MANRELVQLSKTFDSQAVGGFYMSSKLDGFRVVWDGGVTRGVPKPQVPWANNAKDARYLEPQVATGLWTRYGNVVHAPNWFLDGLPTGKVLDGEFWNPLLSRQQIRSICARLKPDEYEWKHIQFHVFGRLCPEVWLAPGRISSPNYTKIITKEALMFYYGHKGEPFGIHPNGLVYEHLQKLAEFWPDNVRAVHQELLPNSQALAKEMIRLRLLEEMRKPRGEGLILTNSNGFQEMKRTSSSLKVKPRDDSEGRVVGYIAGKEGKLRGMLGALILDWQGKRLELSGFTDAERQLSETSWAYNHPGEELPEDIVCLRFPIGSQVTFSYRGLTDDSIPNEACYFRGRD